MTGNHIPSKTQITLLERAKRNQGEWVSGGCGWQARWMSPELYEVYHYGQECITIGYGWYRIGEDMHSNSDRTGINSVLFLYDIEDRYRVKDGRVVMA